MSLTKAYLALGSNQGQRLKQMHTAVQLLDKEGITTVAASHVYENRAIGMGAADPFLNAVVDVNTGLDPEALLEVCLDVERTLGRVRSKAWAPRTIDIDILAYGELQMKTGRLQLPHPRIVERDFVLKPFVDVAPDFKLHGQTVSAWLKQLNEVELKRIVGKLI